MNVASEMKRLAVVAMIALMPAAASAGLAETEHQPSDLSKALNLVMSTATPTLYFHIRELMVEQYEKAAINKALAVNIKSAEYWQTADQDSQSVTVDRTLEGCELRFGSPCKLLAVNDELVQAGPVTEREMPRLKYSGGFDLNQLPIVKDEVRNRPDIQTYLSGQRSKAIAINPMGEMFVVADRPSDKEAADMALARCDAAPGRKKSDGPCYLYSLNNDVVIAQRKTFPWTPSH